LQPLPGARRTRRRCSGSCGPTARWRPMGWKHARPWHGRPPRVGRPARVRAPSGLVAARAAREAWGLTRRAAGVPFLAPTARARVKRLGVWRGGSAEEPSRDAHGERRSRGGHHGAPVGLCAASLGRCATPPGAAVVCLARGGGQGGQAEPQQAADVAGGPRPAGAHAVRACGVRGLLPPRVGTARWRAPGRHGRRRASGPQQPRPSPRRWPRRRRPARPKAARGRAPAASEPRPLRGPRGWRAALRPWRGGSAAREAGPALSRPCLPAWRGAATARPSAVPGTTREQRGAARRAARA